MPNTGNTAAPAAEEHETEWGGAPLMGPMDTIMWRGDSVDRHFRATMSAVEVLDRVPDWGRLVAAHDWATRMLPRFRQRVAESPLGIGAPGWVVDDEFDLDYHVRRARVPGDGSWQELWQLVKQSAMTPLDPKRPPWEAILFDGLPDGRAAYLIKVHHALTDGLGALDALSRLHSTRRSPVRDKPQPAAPDPTTGAADGWELMRRQLGADLGRLPAVAGALGSGLRSLVHPRSAVDSVIRYGRSAYRVSGMATEAGSELLAPRSMGRHFDAFDVELADLKAAGKACGASVNDVYLAGLTAGLRRYHEKLGAELTNIPVALPISTRRTDDAAGGNQIAMGRISAPMSLSDPTELLVTIGEEVRLAREEPAAELFGLMGPVIAWLPASAMGMLGGATSVNDLQASNMPGIRHTTYLAGAKVERIYPFGPLPGCAVMATMITHGTVGCIGINLDTAAVTDTELFAECLMSGFADILDPTGGAPLVRRV